MINGLLSGRDQEEISMMSVLCNEGRTAICGSSIQKVCTWSSWHTGMLWKHLLRIWSIELRVIGVHCGIYEFLRVKIFLWRVVRVCN